MATASNTKSDVGESGAGARTVGVGAGAQAGQSGAGVDVGMDIGQTEGFTGQNLKEARLTFTNDKAAVDQQQTQSQQRNSEYALIQAESIAQQARINEIQNQGLMDNQRLAREAAADSRRHADSGFITMLEAVAYNDLQATSEVQKALGVLTAFVIANAATGRPPVNTSGEGSGA